jgi:hypothetical protein
MTKEEFVQGKKVLTLQIDRECFEAIRSGEQKIEHRYIYPRNQKQYVFFVCDDKRYLKQCDIPDNGKEIVVVPVRYDALYFINGRRKDAPRMMVEVESAEFYILTDDGGNDLTYMQDGCEYYAAQVWYHLGKVVFTENC